MQNAQYLTSISDHRHEAWDRLFGAASEGFEYYLACEHAALPTFSLGALGLSDEGVLIAGAPAFEGEFQLDMMLEGGARRVAHKFAERFSGSRTFKILGAGSPHADELALGFDPGLDHNQRCQALSSLLDALEFRAAARGIGMTFLKNVTDRDSAWAHDVLKRRGYVRVSTLPVASLAVPASEEAYIASLSANMRSNLRRKLKRACAVRVEMRNSVEGVEEEIFALREATRRRASVNYDAFSELSHNYFHEVLSRMGERARLLLYWRDDKLISFALVLLEPARLIEKYDGMCYPDGPDNGIFFLNWMTQVRLCLERGIPVLHAGETTYLTKARLGCKLHRSWIYFRHRQGMVNWLYWAISRFVRFDSTDPDLRKLGPAAPYISR